MEADKELPVSDKKTRLTAGKVQDRLDKVVENTDKAISNLASEIEEIGNTNKAILEFMKSNKAKDTPVVIRPTLEAADQDLGVSRDMDDTSIVTGMFDINSPQFQDKERIERFMHEKVRVKIYESNNDMEVDHFSVSVNNKSVMFRFGDEKEVPRYIVEQLARAKPVSYQNKEVTLSDGARTVLNTSTKGLRYPFTTIGDSKIGNSWLQCVLAQD